MCHRLGLRCRDEGFKYLLNVTMEDRDGGNLRRQSAVVSCAKKDHRQCTSPYYLSRELRQRHPVPRPHQTTSRRPGRNRRNRRVHLINVRPSVSLLWQCPHPYPLAAFAGHVFSVCVCRHRPAGPITRYPEPARGLLPEPLPLPQPLPPLPSPLGLPLRPPGVQQQGPAALTARLGSRWIGGAPSPQLRQPRPLYPLTPKPVTSPPPPHPHPLLSPPPPSPPKFLPGEPHRSPVTSRLPPPPSPRPTTHHPPWRLPMASARSLLPTPWSTASTLRRTASPSRLSTIFPSTPTRSRPSSTWLSRFPDGPMPSLRYVCPARATRLRSDELYSECLIYCLFKICPSFSVPRDVIADLILPSRSPRRNS